MVVDGPCREEQPGRDLVVLEPRRDVSQDLELARCQAPGVGAGGRTGTAPDRGRTERPESPDRERGGGLRSQSVELGVGLLDITDAVGVEEGTSRFIWAVQREPRLRGLAPVPLDLQPPGLRRRCPERAGRRP